MFFLLHRERALSTKTMRLREMKSVEERRVGVKERRSALKGGGEASKVNEEAINDVGKE